MDLRCFISIEIPNKLKKNIDTLTERLRSTGSDVKWVSADNLHLTLKFLGNTPEEKLPEIKDCLKAAVSCSPVFAVSLSGTGVFPSKSKPRVIWIGIQDSDEIVRLQSDIEKSLKTIGYEPEERPFRAHLTIGRARSMRGRDLLLMEIDSLEKTEFGEFRADEISLMKSDLKASGAIYARLYSIPLMG